MKPGPLKIINRRVVMLQENNGVYKTLMKNKYAILQFQFGEMKCITTHGWRKDINKNGNLRLQARMSVSNILM
jgi:hypothetical protein